MRGYKSIVGFSPGRENEVDLKSVTLNFALCRGTKFDSPFPVLRVVFFSLSLSRSPLFLCILWQVSTGIYPRVVLLPRSTLFRLRVSFESCILSVSRVRFFCQSCASFLLLFFFFSASCALCLWFFFFRICFFRFFPFCTFAHRVSRKRDNTFYGRAK